MSVAVEKELPKGWVKAKLNDVCEIKGRVGWRGYKKSDLRPDGIYVLGGEHIDNDGTIDLSKPKFISEEKYLESPEIMVNPNDIILSHTGSIGKIMIVPSKFGKATINPNVLLVKNILIDHIFLYYFFKGPIFQTIIFEGNKSTTIPTITQKFLKSQIMLSPPLNEQKRIVAKIEELFSLVDSAKDTLEKTKVLLKQYRQSILKHAFEGKLVPQDPDDESVSTLLKKIIPDYSEQKNQLDLEEIESILAIHELPKTWINSELRNLPKTWKLIELDHISKIIDSLHTTPKYSEKGIPMVRSTEIKFGNLDLKNALKVSQEIFEQYTRKYKPQKNDIVMSRVGTYFVTSYVNTDELFCIGQNTLVIHPMIFSLYLYYVLNSSFVNKQIDIKYVGTTGQKTISLKNIRNLLISLPPLNEQKRIVAKIEESFSLIEKNEILIDKLLLQYKQMKNSILKQAFEGKLVPQDPNDEPAEVLLQRIREEKNGK